jgi:1,2-diacylglycerol 3-alpha-glucosyltransferase
MKITSCQFTDAYFPIMDGVGMTAHNYASWLNRKYGKSFIVAPSVKDFKDSTEYKVLRFKSVLLPGMNPYRVGLPLLDIRFKKKLKEEKFDILHAHSPFVSGQLALKLAKKLNIPVIATFHSKYRDDFKKVVNAELFVEFLMQISLSFYHSADYVWVPNKATGETLKEYGYRGSYDIVNNGTDMEIPEKSQLMKFRKKGLEAIGANSDEFVMLFVGQHRWEKNVKMIIEALKILKGKGESFKMVFVGEGYAENDMKKLVKKYKLSEYVVFMGLITSRKELKNIYACSDLFVFPSIYDNSPLVIQEAAAFDVPSVVVRSSSSAEGILDTVNGFLIENETVALARALSDLMDYPETIRKAGAGARKSLYRNWETIVDEVNMKYTDILNVHHPDNAERKHHAGKEMIEFNPLVTEKGHITMAFPEK